MLQDYYENFETFRNKVDEAKEHLGYDLWNNNQKEEETQNKTHFTQPALLAPSYSI
ncbi:[acyl-carrier-protein] S-malonyltransferase, partial [Francisella tularensis subsp. holarctica]|nr:[acyl-carrier-protein] S-malonyltransferase [Francisella tularensis subsp. holarctica]